LPLDRQQRTGSAFRQRSQARPQTGGGKKIIRSYGWHLRGTRQCERQVLPHRRAEVPSQRVELRAVRAERAERNVSRARTGGARFQTNPRTGRQSPAGLLRSAALDSGPRRRTRAETARGYSLGQAPLLSRIRPVEKGGPRNRPAGGERV